MPEPNSGCWLWIGRAQGRYGTVSVGDRRIPAHRAAWEEKNGPIPPGLVACHKCDNTFCVNPDHIFIGTQSDNITDMWAKGRRQYTGYLARSLLKRSTEV